MTDEEIVQVALIARGAVASYYLDIGQARLAAGALRGELDRSPIMTGAFAVARNVRTAPTIATRQVATEHLRDRFAMHALASAIPCTMDGMIEDAPELAVWAYEVADEMLSARAAVRGRRTR